MTVIFHTNAGRPVLAGDMLLSVQGPGGHTDLRLPSQPGGITIPSDTIPSYIPIKMRRKIFIVNDHLAVGAAGLASDVSTFMEDIIEEFCNKNDFTHDDITKYLRQYALKQGRNEAFENVGALILVEARDWRGSLTKGLTKHKNIVTQRFGRVVAIGTGACSIVEEINSLDNRYEYGVSQPPDGETRFPEFGALVANLTLLANIYWKEFTAPDSVFEAWGGAYDLIYQDAHGIFRYLDEYTIFLRLFDGSKPEKGIQLMNVLKYERRPEVSFIVMLNDGKLDFFGAKDITASDDPISITFRSGELTMNSRVHVSIIAVGHGNRLLHPIIQIDGLDPAEDGRQTVFTDFDDDGRLRVMFHSQHDEWLTEQVKSYYESHARHWY